MRPAGREKRGQWKIVWLARSCRVMWSRVGQLVWGLGVEFWAAIYDGGWVCRWVDMSLGFPMCPCFLILLRGVCIAQSYGILPAMLLHGRLSSVPVGYTSPN